MVLFKALLMFIYIYIYMSSSGRLALNEVLFTCKMSLKRLFYKQYLFRRDTGRAVESEEIRVTSLL